MARILVVDDEASVRKLVVRLLRELGNDVVDAKSGQEAIALARVAAPDMVLLDIDMPGMDGLETLRHLRREAPKAIVIMVSGIDDEPRALRALEEGARDFVHKPFDVSHLKEVVLRHLALAA